MICLLCNKSKMSAGTKWFFACISFCLWFISFYMKVLFVLHCGAVEIPKFQKGLPPLEQTQNYYNAISEITTCSKWDVPHICSGQKGSIETLEPLIFLKYSACLRKFCVVTNTCKLLKTFLHAIPTFWLQYCIKMSEREMKQNWVTAITFDVWASVRNPLPTQSYK